MSGERAREEASGGEERPGGQRRQLTASLVLGVGLGLTFGVPGGLLLGLPFAIFGAGVGLAAAAVKVVEAIAARRVQAGAWGAGLAATTIFSVAAAGHAAAVVQAVALPGLAGPHEALTAALRTLTLPGTVGLLPLLGFFVLLGAVVHVIGAAPSRGARGAQVWGGAVEVEGALLRVAALVVGGNALVGAWLMADGVGVGLILFVGLLVMQSVAVLLGALVLISLEEAVWRLVDRLAPRE